MNVTAAAWSVDQIKTLNLAPERNRVRCDFAVNGFPDALDTLTN
jgi:hypothetical protein